MKNIYTYILSLFYFLTLVPGNISASNKRVVVLEYGILESVVLLGIRPVGIADDNDPKRILRHISTDLLTWKSVGTRKHPQLKLIANLKPDLIIGDIKRHNIFLEVFNKIAPTYLVKSLGEDYQTQITTFKEIATILGKSKQANKLIKAHQLKLSQLASRSKSISNKRIVFGVTWEKGVHLHSLKGFVPSLLEKIGFTYGIKRSNSVFNFASHKINFEQLLKIRPDILIVAKSSSYTQLEQWKKNKLWRFLKLERGKNLFFVDQNLWTRYRGPLTAELISRHLVKFIDKGSHDSSKI